MAQLIQMLVLLTALDTPSGGVADSPLRSAKISGSILPTALATFDIQDAVRFQQGESIQQQRVKNMGAAGVVYFDAPPNHSQQRILR